MKNKSPWSTNILPIQKTVLPGFIAHHYRLDALTISEHLVTDHQLDVHLGPPSRLNICQDGHLKAGRFFRGDMIYTPPGVQCGGNWNEPRDVLILSLSTDFIIATLQDSIRGNSPEIAAQFKLHDPLIEQISFALASELEKGEGEEDELYTESLANALAAHLVKRYSTRSQSALECRGGLPGRKLRRVIEYIHDNLSEGLRLSDIAERVNYSPIYLTRLFKKSTGIPVHQYVMQQRVDQAKRLLIDNIEMPITQVALDCGFQDQSHFTKVFHRRLGVTPKTYRDLR